MKNNTTTQSTTQWSAWWFDTRRLLEGILLFFVKLFGGFLGLWFLVVILDSHSMSPRSILGGLLWLLLAFLMLCWVVCSPVVGLARRLCWASAKLTPLAQVPVDAYRGLEEEPNFQLEMGLNTQATKSVLISLASLRGFRRGFVPATYLVRPWYQVLMCIERRGKPGELVLFEAMPEPQAQQLLAWLVAQTGSVVDPNIEPAASGELSLAQMDNPIDKASQSVWRGSWYEQGHSFFSSLLEKPQQVSIEVTPVTKNIASEDRGIPTSPGFLIQVSRVGGPAHSVSVSAASLRGFRRDYVTLEDPLASWYRILICTSENGRESTQPLLELVPGEQAQPLIEWLAEQTNSVTISDNE